MLIEPGDFQSRLPLPPHGRRRGDDSRLPGRFSVAKAQGAPTPEPVARLVERVLRDPDPALRRSVGMAGQRIVVPLNPLLPQPIFEWALRRALKLG